MINIICNLLKPETGHVLIDGKKFTFDDESWKLDTDMFRNQRFD